MKINYIVIPLIAAAAIYSGSQLTNSGMEWYRGLALPAWTPPGWVIGAVWTVIYILATTAALIAWNKTSSDGHSAMIAVAFIANVALNVLWSYLFFNQHQIGAAIVEMLILNASVVALIIMLWPVSRVASLLLLPYFIWVTFATFLAYAVWQLNT